jgi:hypothetical protein
LSEQINGLGERRLRLRHPAGGNLQLAQFDVARCLPLAEVGSSGLLLGQLFQEDQGVTRRRLRIGQPARGGQQPAPLDQGRGQIVAEFGAARHLGDQAI